jgi:predicted HTH domain antitoxin
MALTISDDRLENIRLLPEIREKAIKKAKEGYVMALLEAGEISSGKAAEILGVSRLETIEMMNKWGISIFDDSQDLEGLRQEVERAERGNRQQGQCILNAS